MGSQSPAFVYAQHFPELILETQLDGHSLSHRHGGARNAASVAAPGSLPADS